MNKKLNIIDAEEKILEFFKTIYDRVWVEVQSPDRILMMGRKDDWKFYYIFTLDMLNDYREDLNKLFEAIREELWRVRPLKGKPR